MPLLCQEEQTLPCHFVEKPAELPNEKRFLKLPKFEEMVRGGEMDLALGLFAFTPRLDG